ncbi:MAG: exosome complex RNA-binding protein Rrp4 [Candidatus Bathyarchaeia archaeon]
MPTFAQNRELVTPGTLLAKGDFVAGEHTYRRGDCVYSKYIGLVEYSDDRVSVIALSGRYIPKVDDAVIGLVTNSHFQSWDLEINSPYVAKLQSSDFWRRIDLTKDDLSELLGVGAVVMGRITRSDPLKGTTLTIRGRGLGEVRDGRLVVISPAKVPRLIGRGGSMIKMLVKKTGCSIRVGQNGIIVVRGRSRKKEEQTISAIKQVEMEAHTSGLTDRISAMLLGRLP